MAERNTGYWYSRISLESFETILLPFKQLKVPLVYWSLVEQLYLIFPNLWFLATLTVSSVGFIPWSGPYNH